MTRLRLNLNREWRFLREDAPADQVAAPHFDDSGWQPVGLPHTFDLPYFRTPEFYVGVGWYRKRIDCTTIPRAETSLSFIEFDGAFQVADVFVDGKHAGTHRGGYTGFQIPIGQLPASGEIVLAVRVSNAWDAQLQPRAGEHIFSGGLYRDVHLLITNPLHITWNGVCVTTPHVSAESAVVNIRTEVRNASPLPVECAVEQSLIAPGGEEVQRFSASRLLAPGETAELDQAGEPVGGPQLWHPDHPHLYSVRTRLLDVSGDAVDEVTSPLGFRWFEWTADRGFFLNGEHLYLRGANAHQDHAGWGIAITRAACERDVRLIKAAGFNFVRGAHYPHHPAFADACDRIGLIFWSENAFWGKGGFGPEGYWNASAYPVNAEDFEPFEQSCKQQLAEMIRINFNHPSIIVWSLTNEAFFTYNLDRARALIRELANLTRSLDPTRLVGIGGAQRGEVDHLGDVAGYNGDGARLFINPGVPNMVSEYGAISKPHEAFEAFFGDLQAEPLPWRGGQAIWAAFDYGSIAGRQGLKGIIDHQRLPKQSWYWYRQAYRGIAPSPEPADTPPARLHLTCDKSIIHGTGATDDCQLIVTVQDAAGRHVAAAPAVTLTIESGPGEFPTGRSITFSADSNNPITRGRAAIALRSYHSGTSVIRATSPGLEPDALAITTVGEPVFDGTVVPERPYTPPPMSAAALAAMKNAVNVALNRPSRASCEFDGHPARCGNDGDARTHWSAADQPGVAWWQVDLEGFYQIASSRLTFPTEGNWQYTVSLSRNGVEWTVAVDRSATQNESITRNDIYPPGATARYVRATWTRAPAGWRPSLSEIEILGVLSVR